MGWFEDLDDETLSLILTRWQSMSENDQNHFINQVSIALSVWGSDEEGKHMIVIVLQKLVSNGSSTLADFGVYLDSLLKEKKFPTSRMENVRRASLILEGYRIKNNLSSEIHKEV